MTPSQKVDLFLSRIQILLACCIVVAATAGCRAQTPANKKLNSQLDIRIQTAIRNELSVPPEYKVTIGPEKKSELSGYNSILVTFSLPGHPNRTQHLEYLVSKNGNTLARLSKIDISKNPQSMLPIQGRPIRGNPNAKVTLVNFDDLECPFCAKLHAELFPGIMNRYKGLLRVIYVDFPLTELHPWAMHAAVDANCLAAQNGKAYWHFVDYVHEHGEQITGPSRDVSKAFTRLDKLTKQVGGSYHLNSTKLDACVAKQNESGIRKEMKVGEQLGISATPTFYVNGVRWAGVLSKPELEMMINRALRQQGIQPPPPSAPSGGASTKSQAPAKGSAAQAKG